MSKVIDVGTIVVGSSTTWVPKNLVFWINSPPKTGPLAMYDFYLSVLSPDGREEVYKDQLDKPDVHGRIFAPRKYLDPRGGVLILSGHYIGKVGDHKWSRDPINVNIEISGWCRYSTNMSGKYLLFKVDPVTVQSSSDTDSVTDSRAASGSTKSAGVSHIFAGAVTQPGDVLMHAEGSTRTQNVTSVTGLNVTQSPAALK